MSGSRWQSARALGAALALALLAPIGSASAQDAGASVDMSSIKFAPKVIHVAAGQSVLWTNSDPVQHTITADDGSFDSAWSSTRLARSSTTASRTARLEGLAWPRRSSSTGRSGELNDPTPFPPVVDAGGQ